MKTKDWDLTCISDKMNIRYTFDEKKKWTLKKQKVNNIVYTCRKKAEF